MYFYSKYMADNIKYIFFIFLYIFYKVDYKKLHREYKRIPGVDRSDLELLEDISKSIPLPEPYLILKVK